MKLRLFLIAFLLLSVSVIPSITSAQRRTETDKPLTGDFKITYRSSIGGQAAQTTTMIKGQRERSETSVPGYTTVTITQCDMKRTIQVNDQARKYLITPMDDGSPSPNASTSAPQASTPITRGGVVTTTLSTVDTGERKQILGYNARHIKRTMVIDSSPDACSPSKMKVETDGWYINLEYGVSCPANQRTYTPPTTSGGCRDRNVHKATGPANIGYPVQETMTMYGADGSVTTTMTKEVVEISRQPLDIALFDIPAGYNAARDQMEMYSTSSMNETTGSSPQPSRTESGNQTQASAPARIRVGVVQVNNKTKTSTSTDSLQQQLVADLTGQGIDAVALNAISPSEAVAEAQAKQVAYILYTDVATLKAPSAGKKIGGMFGRATGIGSNDTGKAEAKLDFRLVPTGGTSPVAQSSATAKEETVEASLNAAIRGAAQAVADGLPRP